EAADSIGGRRPLHVFLEVFLPDPRPRPIVEIAHGVLDGRPRRDLRSSTVFADEDGLVAVLEMERWSVFEIAPAREEADVAHRLYEPLGVVKDRLVLETGELPVSEASRRPDLDQLHLV